jgi:ceramide glucosyltransferase
MTARLIGGAAKSILPTGRAPSAGPGGGFLIRHGKITKSGRAPARCCDFADHQAAIVVVSLAAIPAVAAAIWWVSSAAILLLSFLAALSHPLRKSRAALGKDMPSLTAIVPVKFLHAGFEEAQRSLFAQAHEGLEIVIVAAESASPAIAAVQRIRAEYPGVASRLLQSDCNRAVSPKLNNIWPAICEARNDIILTKDSNIRLEPGEIADLVRHLGPTTGLVSTISIATQPDSFAAWIEASIINCYHARVLMLADAAGLGFGLGKIMLFRRSDLARAGGFGSLAWALGEDMALSGAMHGLGLRTILADCVSDQMLGARRFSDFWQRQLRWMVIWRVQLPAVFFADLLGSAVPTALAGALAANAFRLPPATVAAGTLIVWFCAESLLCAAKGWPISLWSPLAFIGREILTPMLWIRAWTTSDVAWAGAMYRATARRDAGAFSRAESSSSRARDADK